MSIASKFWYGTVRKTETGSIQYARNETKKKDYLIVSGRHGDIWIPLDTVYQALEDHWVADSAESKERKAK